MLGTQRTDLPITGSFLAGCLPYATVLPSLPPAREMIAKFGMAFGQGLKIHELAAGIAIEQFFAGMAGRLVRRLAGRKLP